MYERLCAWAFCLLSCLVLSFVFCLLWVCFQALKAAFARRFRAEKLLDFRFGILLRFEHKPSIEDSVCVSVCPEMESQRIKIHRLGYRFFYRILNPYTRVWFFWKSQTFGKSLETFARIISVTSISEERSGKTFGAFSAPFCLNRE